MRRDLDEISSEIKIPLASCQRQVFFSSFFCVFLPNLIEKKKTYFNSLVRQFKKNIKKYRGFG